MRSPSVLSADATKQSWAFEADCDSHQLADTIIEDLWFSRAAIYGWQKSHDGINILKRSQNRTSRCSTRFAQRARCHIHSRDPDWHHQGWGDSELSQRAKTMCTVCQLLQKWEDMEVSWGFHKWGYPKMDGLQWNILSKWMIWRYKYFRKPSICVCFVVLIFLFQDGKTGGYLHK